MTLLGLAAWAAMSPAGAAAQCPDGMAVVPARLELASLVGEYELRVRATRGPKRGQLTTSRLEMRLPPPPPPRPAPDTAASPGVFMLSTTWDFDLVGQVDARLVHWLFDWIKGPPEPAADERAGVGLSYFPQVDASTGESWGSIYLHLGVRADGTDPVMFGNGPDVFHVDCLGPQGFTGSWSRGTVEVRRW